MIIKRMTIAACCAVMLTGCATAYQSQDNLLTGWTGGYSDSPGPGELVHVVFNGNGYSNQDKISLYLLYRCAELAQKNGKPYFTIYQSIAHAVVDKPLTTSFATNVAGKPMSSVYMLYQSSAVPNAISTAEILRKYGAEVKGVGKS